MSAQLTHEKLSQLWKMGEQTIRDQQSKVAQQKQALESLADKVVQADLYKKAVECTLDLVRSGVVNIDSFETKVAELVGKGERGIEVVREARQMIATEKGASFRIVENEDQSTDTEAESSGDHNEAVEYLAEFAASHESAQ